MSRYENRPLLSTFRDSSSSRRDVLRYGAALGTTGWLTGCMSQNAAGPQPTSLSSGLDQLIRDASKEHSLNTIALPPDFVNYGTIMNTYEKKFGLHIVRGSPNASSAEQLSAVRMLKGAGRAPDVVDIGPPFALQAVGDSLTARYKVSTWDSIPSELKHPEGRWVGDYWGVIGWGVNADAVGGTTPRTWHDLLDAIYKGKVALDGDPRESGSAFAAVFSAALANGGSLDDIEPGIDFFSEMKKAGTFIPVNATPATALQGETPVMISWDYGLMSLADELRGKIDWQVYIPKDGIFGNYYCQAINRNAPHPLAARLWQEFLFSDEGQLLWLKGYAHPARYADMRSRGVIPKKVLDRLPLDSSYQGLQFPTARQTKAAIAVVRDNWSSKVANR
ncbi:extracellular solute-binding protein [Streptomyces sp. NPDC007095]|jgi:putative spermidine/putrescine transport system substrate-binding protein|uniref:extracellular solute-binding protein n=1 Tax=Streptomyces sp. NPDC007095 TaxID=3154482 RepID=UPI000C70A33A